MMQYKVKNCGNKSWCILVSFLEANLVYFLSTDRQTWQPFATAATAADHNKLYSKVDQVFPNHDLHSRPDPGVRGRAEGHHLHLLIQLPPHVSIHGHHPGVSRCLRSRPTTPRPPFGPGLFLKILPRSFPTSTPFAGGGS